ncbi:hypothetical protein [Vibrio casei]|nr:hypothetical protein [Vibrio casei]
MKNFRFVTFLCARLVKVISHHCHPISHRVIVMSTMMSDKRNN